MSIRSRRAFLAASFALFSSKGLSDSREFSDKELDSIGRRIWLNECGGRRDGLTSWNSGEQFGSFGIGHFIWYPAGKKGPFEEGFPPLARFLAEQGEKVPAWALDQPCPWSNKAEFQTDFRGVRMEQLRDLLEGTVRLQAAFIVQRMERSLPKILDAAPAAQRENVKTQFERMRATAGGAFALIDYVNFKGEGIKETERYKGEGWGLLQVLSGMSGKGRGAVKEFARSAEAVLTRRVTNSPPARGEARWLQGWKNRVRRYVTG